MIDVTDKLDKWLMLTNATTKFTVVSPPPEDKSRRVTSNFYPYLLEADTEDALMDMVFTDATRNSDGDYVIEDSDSNLLYTPKSEFEIVSQKSNQLLTNRFLLNINNSMTQIDSTLRLYAIVRSDIYMPLGKIVAQAGHAYLHTLLDAPHSLVDQYHSDGIGTKVCLHTDKPHKLLHIHEHAKEAGLPTFKVYDSGHICPPDFDGSEILTAVGIGPATREQVEFLKNFKTLKENYYDKVCK